MINDERNERNERKYVIHNNIKYTTTIKY